MMSKVYDPALILDIISWRRYRLQPTTRLVRYGVEHMSGFDRRAFLGMSVGAMSMLPYPRTAAAAQAACVSGGLPGFLPQRLTVDCASRQNFHLFRKNTDYLGLAGVVSMARISGKLGSYEPASMFVFPWLKPEGQALKQVLAAVVPINSTRFMSAMPIPDATLPVDEYFCNFRLQAPAATSMFIGFQVGPPYSPVEGRFDWFTNVDTLADGEGVGIDWTSSNLNQRWFGGGQFIPNEDRCNGNAWRKLIVDGLNQAAEGLC